MKVLLRSHLLYSIYSKMGWRSWQNLAIGKSENLSIPAKVDGITNIDIVLYEN